MLPSLSRMVVALAAVACLATAAPFWALAKDQTTQPQIAQTDAQQAPQPNGKIESDFSDEVLLAYVAAAQSVGEVVMSYRDKVENAGSQEEAVALQEEARQTAMTKIESTPGMDLETYKQVSQAVRQDPDLLQKLRQMAAETQ